MLSLEKMSKEQLVEAFNEIETGDLVMYKNTTFVVDKGPQVVALGLGKIGIYFTDVTSPGFQKPEVQAPGYWSSVIEPEHYAMLWAHIRSSKTENSVFTVEDAAEQISSGTVYIG